MQEWFFLSLSLTFILSIWSEIWNEDLFARRCNMTKAQWKMTAVPIGGLPKRATADCAVPVHWRILSLSLSHFGVRTFSFFFIWSGFNLSVCTRTFFYFSNEGTKLGQVYACAWPFDGIWCCGTASTTISSSAEANQASNTNLFNNGAAYLIWWSQQQSKQMLQKGRAEWTSGTEGENQFHFILHACT